MNRANKFSMLSLTGLAAISFAGAANADTLMYSASAPFATTEISGTLTLPQFNVPGAILDSISLMATADATNSGTLTNTAAQPQSFTQSFTTQVKLAGPNSISLKPAPGTSQDFTDLAVNVPTAYGPLTGTDTKTVAPALADFGLYTGAGSISLAYSSLSGQSTLGGGGNVNSAVSTVADVSAKIVYTYHTPSAVPEPGSVALLLTSGVTGAGLLARRRAKK